MPQSIRKRIRVVQVAPPRKSRFELSKIVVIVVFLYQLYVVDQGLTQYLLQSYGFFALSVQALDFWLGIKRTWLQYGIYCVKLYVSVLITSYAGYIFGLMLKIYRLQ
jgi:hypothetical protein